MKNFLRDFFSNFIGIIFADIYQLIISPVEIIMYMVILFIIRIRSTDDELIEIYTDVAYGYSMRLDYCKHAGLIWHYSIVYLEWYILYKYHEKESKKLTKKLNLKEKEI